MFITRLWIFYLIMSSFLNKCNRRLEVNSFWLTAFTELCLQLGYRLIFNNMYESQVKASQWSSCKAFLSDRLITCLRSQMPNLLFRFPAYRWQHMAPINRLMPSHIIESQDMRSWSWWALVYSVSARFVCTFVLLLFVSPVSVASRVQLLLH